ncbi:MAG TPA: MarR family transcriptional regulator [Polyangia bacterium]|nr:MarR family transcriptional regulator [Polyangia bacterium]
MAKARRAAGSPAAGQARLVDALAQSAFVTMAELSKVGADHELSLTQLRVLAILRDRRPRMADLAAYLGLERSTMTGLVDRAERRGLIARAPSDDDGRAVDVTLSRDGHTLAERVYADVKRALSPQTDQLTAAEQRRLHALLRKMLAPLEARAEAATNVRGNRSRRS